MKIDEMARNIVSAFVKDDHEVLKQETMKMLRQIHEYEGMFSIVEEPYVVAKSLYFMLTDNYLTDENKVSVLKLAYFCLLKNYLKNKDRIFGETGYEDLVSGSKLAVVLIAMQPDFLMYYVLMGQSQFLDPKTHLRNQMLLFGGIAKEADIALQNFHLEEIVSSYYGDILNEMYDMFPTGKNLALLKDDCTHIIRRIEMDISANLKEFWMEEYM